VFLRSLLWWRLEPAPERAQLDPAPAELWQRPACAVAAGSTWVAYLPRATGRMVLKGIEPLAWIARWLDPRTGATHDAGSVDVSPSHKWRAPEAPSEEDWVLVLTVDG